MLVIRFNRTGKRNHASFRVVLQEHTKAPGKRHVEILGSYDPHKKTAVLKKDRILYWIGQGAQTSPVVTNLLIREGVIEGKKIAKKIPLPVVSEPVAAETAPVEAVQAEETVSAEAPVTEAEAEEKKEEVPVAERETEAPIEAIVPAQSEVIPAEVAVETQAETAPIPAEVPKA